MIFFGDLFELRNVKQLCEIVKMEHRVVLAVFAKERHVLAKVHVFQVIGDEAAVTTLYALPELF